MTAKQVYDYYVSSLSTIYEKSEAENITHWILEDKLGLTKAGLKIREHDTISEVKANELATILLRLQKGEPVQYVLGYTEFFGLKLKVNPAVLIPRPETEELVDWIIKDNQQSHELRILDIGTGSGCIAIALKKNMPDASVTAIDISEEALNVAKENATLMETPIQFIKEDILLTTGSTHSPGLHSLSPFDIIVSNPPYVTTAEKGQMKLNVLQFEPPLALFVPENDPFKFYKAIAEYGRNYLPGQGKLYFEVNENLMDEVVSLLKATGYQGVEGAKDMSGRNRMVRAVRG